MGHFKSYLIFSIVSIFLFYTMSAPMFFAFPYFLYPLRIVVFSLGYAFVLDWKALLLYPVLFLFCLPGIWSPLYTVVLIPVYNLVAYLVAGFGGGGWKGRLASIASYWVLLQLTEVFVSLLASAVGVGRSPSGPPAPPYPQYAPFYLLAYMILTVAHQEILTRVQPGYRPWLARKLERLGLVKA